ncbi:hypothetical protein SISSUDRAFT_983935 [Sistotremastrum suecicum HHB10207 ss-3]|uniref:Glycosyltransferase family 1 protein n=1 Tax=Sistotremastrum suecicum HHB10207 ss-3 TaxID=1314776 RepID=A0A166EWX1_9AGAM|nr:hypothetical protein SISSUDRAFT_983935 [Sistotremastrum suecicum HHB10207 ss-3]
MPPLRFAYYCSGHGFGHATRVSAFACRLLSIQGVEVFIVSSAPARVLSQCLDQGAHLRQADIDPVIVQPLAYRVDRRKSTEVLARFLSRKDDKLLVEVDWLRRERIDCVLSDAAFLACSAARAASLPSVLITNFTFDSVYSYLATPVIDRDPPSILPATEPDTPVPSAELEPLVNEIHGGYRCADLLLLLPGHIPIPSFGVEPPLPSTGWIARNAFCHDFTDEISDLLLQDQTSIPILPHIDPRVTIPRQVISAPLIVRTPTPKIYTAEGRTEFLTSIGIPSQYHNPEKTKILAVSFGGQTFRKPNSSATNTPARASSPALDDKQLVRNNHAHDLKLKLMLPNHHHNSTPRQSSQTLASTSPIATPSHIFVPGAPPAINTSPVVASTPTFHNYSPLPEEPRFLPSGDWIAVICGLSHAAIQEDHADLPDGFYIAPPSVYVPDLLACCDVMLGKLGYGAVAECVDSCTPFVYVSRPLFIEEYGLKRFLTTEGVGVELSRARYELGDWAARIDEAWMKGRMSKAQKRLRGETGQTTAAAQALADRLVDWTLERTK